MKNKDVLYREEARMALELESILRRPDIDFVKYTKRDCSLGILMRPRWMPLWLWLWVKKIVPSKPWGPLTQRPETLDRLS